MSGSKAYLEHVAIWVKDIQWHIRFFADVLGMTMRVKSTALPMHRASTGHSAACSSFMRRITTAPKGALPTWASCAKTWKRRWWLLRPMA